MARTRNVVAVVGMCIFTACVSTPHSRTPAQASVPQCDPGQNVSPTNVTACAPLACGDPAKQFPVCDIDTAGQCVKFPQPAALASNATLTMQPGCADALPNFQAPQYMYNGQIVGPVMRLQASDTIGITLKNQDQTKVYPFTNIHYHGMNVSPNNTASAYGDNVYVEIPSGGSGIYSVPFQTHPVGSFWYHPHPHSVSEPQVLGGMSGPIIVGDIIGQYYGDSLQPWMTLPDFETILLLKDYVPGSANPAGTGCGVKHVNGLTSGYVAFDAPDPRLLRFINAGANQIYNMYIAARVGGARQTMYVAAIDGNPTFCTDGKNPPQTKTACLVPTTELLLPPGARADVLVDLPPGTHELWTDAVATGKMGDPNCQQQLGWIQVAGSSTSSFDLSQVKSSVTVNRKTYDELSDVLAAQPCTTPLDNAATASGQELTIPFGVAGQTGFSVLASKKIFDMTRLDMQVKLPCVARWNVTNTSDQAAQAEAHVFHIHQLDFVLEADPLCPRPNAFNCVAYRDTVFLSTPADGVVAGFNSTARLQMSFDDYTAGNFVYHCHILNHEDQGMMANLCADPNPEANCKPPVTLSSHGSH